MHQITVESVTKLGEVEWKEIVTAASKSAASRKANSIIRSTCETVQVDKRVNEFDATIEIWRIND
jgi:hypothetical protein